MRTSMLALAACALAAATPAFAEESTSDWSITGSITAVSDYRFRGISLSDEDPAIQPTVNLNHSSGFYVGVWGSNLDNDDANPYGEVEIDLYAGWTKEVATGTTVDAALVYYYYPDQLDGDGFNANYFEPYVSVAQAFGPVTAKAGAHYAVSSEGTGHNDWLYLYGQLSGEIPGTPITLTGKVGHQDFGSNTDYWDWSVGASATFGPITAGVSYVDTDLGDFHNVDPGVVFSLGFAF